MDISPDKQNIDRVFSNTAYYIDFYQRDYRWTDEPVLRLLDDIFFKFKEQYARSETLDPSPETITAHYPWYYLNTYVTNVVGGRTYVVDGQQRLTTLSLILIKLRHLAIHYGSQLQGWIETKIGGQQGFERHFWMNHIGHKKTQKALFEGQPPDDVPVDTGITAQNMVANYRTISAFLDKELKDQRCFETFVFYFLYRLVLINLGVEQTDVSMVFEVINDRGVRLKPYEILKGKLLGQIDKIELDRDKYNELWEERANAINAFKEDEMDAFFRFYLKAKFANNRKDGQRFDGDYHREMFSAGMDGKLGLLHNPGRVKAFLKGEFDYFSLLFIKLRRHYGIDQEHFRGLLYNELLDLDAPFHLVLSVCQQNDPDEDEKIRIVSYEIDRFFTLLQIQNAYDSNEFGTALFEISAKIRERGVDAIRPAFDEVLRETIASRRGVKEAEPLSYSAFRQTGRLSLNIRFVRYFFARIDEFLAKETKVGVRHPIRDLVTKRGQVTGFHVEHILAWNDENLALFDDDEERFEQQRNRLGGILLLKGKDNISSNNEVFSQKLKSYANTLLWNETLRGDSYKSKLDVKALKERHHLDLKPLDRFGPEELEARHRLLYEIVSIIWG
jgi:hypothetical protein